MYITRVPNRDSRPAVLLRESYREGGKVKNRTLANLSSWPEAKVEALSRALKGLPPAGLEGMVEVSRSLPHGHVAAVLGMARELGLDQLIDPAPSRQGDLAAAVITAAVIDGSSKLATARGLRTETAASSLGEVLGLSCCDEDGLYAAMDWLLPRQQAIEDALAARHLRDGTLVLYDVSSAAFEGRTCPLGAIGHARDGVRGRLQIVYGVLTTTEGIPMAVEVFKGNTGDPSTLAAQVTKLKERFGLTHVAIVGDRGMLTKARIKDDLRPARLDWITALRGPAINALMAGGAIQPSLFDNTDMAEISHPDYPGERLIACYNPFLAAERARKRGELLAATEAELEKIAAAARRARRPLRGKDKIALAVGKVINKKKAAKHFIVDITDEGLSWRRDENKIADEAALDGIYVIRTSLPADALPAAGAVDSYKALENVERVFRGLNTDLLIRPIRHRLEERVRAHVLIRMLACYVTWHMQQRLAPMLFKDDDPAAGKAARPSPVAPARRSPAALAKAATKATPGGGPVHSFATLLDDLTTIAASRIQPAGGLPAFTVITTPTPVQRQAFELLGITHRLGYA
ncbi:MAG: IS1634 family transposase [Micromonosporaceae bacterium]